ncbi:ATP-binding protein [Desulfoscipio gibsoniae]|uniref:ATP-binding protein n=1 Tax=Desulfoscipio gibsoniae TaxID=102134 RepID=UPI000310B857|nr:ATP-binding protein [Desulfoscipio gibsoniae]
MIEVDGTHIIAQLDPKVTELTRVYGGIIYPIGQFGSIIKIHYGARLIFGYVGRLRMKSDYEREKGLALESNENARIIEADLFGEGEWVFDNDKWRLDFERGVTTFPLPQQKVYLTPQAELGFIYGEGTGPVILLGEHVGSGGTPCYAEMNELLGKHTAILGSTGAGKSGTVAALLHAILDRGSDAGHQNWHPQIVILDPHNEYGAAFPNHVRLCTDEDSLVLPYWLLNMEETVSLFVGKTEEAATSQTNIIKNALLTARQDGASKINLSSQDITVDSPIPYVLGNLSGLDDFGKRNGVLDEIGFVGAVNKQRPNNQNRKDHEGFNKVLRKVDSLCRDGRLKFMMQGWDGTTDLLPEVVKQFLGDSNPIRIVDLSGVPNEVAGTASSAIARMLFSIKIWQTRGERESNPVLLVCEEAHRYVPNRGEALYEAAQDAIRRLAKEGRKYGIGLMLVSQRPSEVEATVLSQCNSWIVLRITNDSDRSHVQGILPDSLAGLTKVLSGLRRREAIFVGQAAVLPSRIMIRDLVKEGKQLPRSQDINFDTGWQSSPITNEHLTKVGKRWRLQKRDV